MNQLNFHTQKAYKSTPPPNNCDIPIIAKLSEAYQLWHSFLIHLPKITRFTLGKKIDNLFTDCLEIALQASYQPKNKKSDTIKKLNAKFDILKFFLKLLWELKAIDTNKLTAISTPLTEIGKMIGGWMKFYK
ncbi:four helix bundle protein [bacterium]|nr:four helix bundle protein [bacterium]